MKTLLIFCAIILAFLAGAVNTAWAAESGGVVGNSYSSTMIQPTTDTMRITTRKRVRGDINEADKAGTSVNEALVAIQNAAEVRAAIEAKAMGYDVVEVISYRNKSQNIEKRSASRAPGGINEKDFTWGGGTPNYTDEVELIIEVDMKLIAGSMPQNPPASYIDVNEVLQAWGLDQ